MRDLRGIEQALARDPQDRHALHALARLCVERRDPGSELLYRRLLALDPEDPVALLGLARQLDLAGMRAVFDRLEELRPGDPSVLLERVRAERRHNRFEAALAVADRLLAWHPACALGWVARGSTCYRREDYAAAEADFRRAIGLEPDLAPAHFALACILLTQNRWAEGLAEQEWRRRLPARVTLPADIPEWRGDEPLGTHLLLWNDQGFGDALQFLRFVPMVAARGYRITLRLQEGLLRLAEGLPGVADLIGPEDPLPAAERQMTLDGLPHRLGLTDPATSWTGPYLSAPRRTLPGRRCGRPAIGLVWAGSPRHENDSRRSLDPAVLAPLLGRTDIDWYGLQLGRTPVEGIIDLAPSIRDFADTAGVVAGLDLVISVDTAVLHLAGALGRPAWGMLARPADWRWSHEGEGSSWYPSLRLFRQPLSGDWTGAIAAVSEALKEFRPPA